jgi:hypothetical protein
MEEDAAGWYVSLFGSENELRQLHDFLGSPNCRLVLKEKNKGCYLTSCRFSNLTDPKKVFESAKTLLRLIRASAKLELGGDFLSVNVGQGNIKVDSNNAASIIRERVDGCDRWVYMTVVPTATTSVNQVEVSVSGSVKTSDAEFSKPSEREERWYDYYLNRCDEEINRDVLDALFYYAEYTSWYSLWKVFETITLDINSDSDAQAKRQIDKYGWADEDKLNAFGYWAQYYDAMDKHAAFGSRHTRALYRTEEYKPKQKLKRKLKMAKKPPVMEIEEAGQLIGCLLKTWIESKRPETMTFHCFGHFASLLQ